MSIIQPFGKPENNCDYCFQPGARAQCGRCKLISYCSKECQSLAWKTHHKLICAPKGSPEAIYINEDNRGFSKVHYAALFHRNQSLPEPLYRHFATAQCKHGCTPDELAALTAKPPQETTVFLEGRVQPLSQDEYRALTGNWFHPNVYMCPEEVVEIFQKPLKLSSDYNLSIQNESDAEVIARHKANPPDLVIAPEPLMGNGLKTLTEIDSGEVICRFGGELTSRKTRSHLANLDNVNLEDTPFTFDQTRYSGVGRFANEGPPNAVFIPIYENNLPPSFCLRAIRTINVGEFIYWDYGPSHPLKQKKYYLTPVSENKLDLFCRTRIQATHDYFDILNKGKTSAGKGDYFLMQYLIATPRVFFALHLNGALNAEHSLEFFKHPVVNKRIEQVQITVTTSGRIAALENLARMQNNQSLCKALHSIQTVNAFAFNFFCILLDNTTSPDDIPHYYTIANIFDKLYQYANLDLHDRDDEEKEAYDFFPLLQEYVQIPVAIRKENIIGSLLMTLIAKGEGKLGKSTKIAELQLVKKLFSSLCLLKANQVTRPNMNALAEELKNNQ